MPKTVAIGKQDFSVIREQNYFYIDKTSFIKQWWEAGDDTTLITRPRRFGKTLNMSMLEVFFLMSMQTEGICLRDLRFGKKRSIGSYREHILCLIYLLQI